MHTHNNNPKQSVRTISALYFTILGIFATSIIILALFGVGMGELLPMTMAYALAFPIAWINGLIFAKKIIFASSRLICFFYGMMLVVFSLVIFDLCLLFLLNSVHPSMYKHGTSLQSLLELLPFFIIFSFIFVGSWLVFLGGFAALFLRGVFAPNVLKYAKKIEDNYKNKEK